MGLQIDHHSTLGWFLFMIRKAIGRICGALLGNIDVGAALSCSRLDPMVVVPTPPVELDGGDSGLRV